MPSKTDLPLLSKYLGSLSFPCHQSLSVPFSSATFDWMWEFISIHPKSNWLLLSTVTSSVNPRKSFLLAALDAQTTTLLPVWHTMWLTLDHNLVFLFNTSWYKFILVSSAKRIWFKNMGCFFVVLQSQIRRAHPSVFPVVSHLVVKLLYLHPRKCLWDYRFCQRYILQSILGFCRCCEGFYFTKNRIVGTLAFFCDLAGLLMLLSLSVLSVFFCFWLPLL